MLRRQLLVRLGALVMVYILGAVVAIVLLQGVLQDLNHAGAESVASADAIDALESAVVASRDALRDDAPSGDAYRAGILAAGARVRAAFEQVAVHAIATGTGTECFTRIRSMLPGIAPREEWLDEQGIASWREHAPAFADDLMNEISHLRQLNRGDSTVHQLDITRRLRNLIVGLTIAALVALNVTILLFLHTGEIIVRPVEALVAHSRELARERFDSRVETRGAAEFGELAASYNQLAEQLRLNEARKMETLKQLGVSLNHELNNVINIIELQLAYLDRQARGDEATKAKLEQIHENLHRITKTVAALKDVRRAVVTEYADGLLMLDLPRCTEPEEPAADEAAAGSGGQTP
ncbi:MAG: HAMP domain-containing protein [Phycisphaeraceae bacterium]|nr:MAG: HAMP domain-containing protein [Phycisphaeraceae bacterium]